MKHATCLLVLVRGLIIMSARPSVNYGKSGIPFSMIRLTSFDRISEIFDIIVDYPDSHPALIDLRVCFTSVLLQQILTIHGRNASNVLICVVNWCQHSENCKYMLVQVFFAQLLRFCRNRKRLLHPGADTKDILTQYVSMIRCLRMIDPPGVLLHKVADPVRRYLR